jgi:hypothetical protein
MRTVLFLVAATLTAALPAVAQCDWLPGEGFRGVDHEIYCMTTWDPDGPGPALPVLVAGGSMHLAGATTTDRIAAWNGSTWTPLGIGPTSIDPSGTGDVRDVAVVRGDLYANLGRFYPTTNTYATDVLRWTGSAWLPIASGIPGWIGAMADFRGDLVVGGGFTLIQGVPANGIARWDGSNWSPLGSGVTGTFASEPWFGPYVYSLDVQQDRLLVGGVFTTAGTQTSNCIATWDGAAWAAWPGLGPDEFDQPPEVDSITFYQGQAAIAGRFSTGARGDGEVAVWDGTAWEPLNGGSLPSSSLSLHVYGGEMFLAGIGSPAFDLVHWSGQAWERPAGGVDGDVWCMTDFQGELVAAGDFNRAGMFAASKIARWNGSLWQPTEIHGYVSMASASGFDSGILAMQESNGALFAGGQFRGVGSASAPGLARWDGSDWTALPPAPASLHLEYYGANVLARYQQQLLVSTSLRLALWDGQAWTTGPTLPGRKGGACTESLLEHNSQLYAAGLFGDPLTYEDCRVVKWDGQTWTALGTTLNDEVRVLAEFNGDLIAGGHFTGSGSTPVSHVARWNGSAWGPLGAGLNDDVLALAVFRGDLIAGGPFTGSAGLPLSAIARWDGAAWRPLGSGIIARSGRAAILSLNAFENNLIAAGWFDTAGGTPTQSTARWDGQRWSPLGRGLDPNARVQTLAAFQDQLFLGGTFMQAGGHASVDWARWTCAGFCYANCDNSATDPALNVNDFVCFLNRYAAGDSYANCDGSTTPPVLNAADFVCFLNRFAAGCP